jgi:hypothetical protein
VNLFMPVSTRADVTAALTRFHDAGLTPVLSTNGAIPDADVQVVRVPADQRTQGEPNAILDVWVTEKGEARLGKAHEDFARGQMTGDPQASRTASQPEAIRTGSGT